jgi:hypothetical protein
VKIRVWLKDSGYSDIRAYSKISFVIDAGILKTADCGKIPEKP